MSRLLIIACSQKKRKDEGLLPAIERYDGPAFRVLRKYLREAQCDAPVVYVLSAEFGLILGSQLIPDYDRLMSKERADAISAVVGDRFRALVRASEWSSVALSLGKTYRDTLGDSPEAESAIIIGGGLGRRLTNMRAWLRGEAE